MGSGTWGDVRAGFRACDSLDPKSPLLLLQPCVPSFSLIDVSMGLFMSPLQSLHLHLFNVVQTLA